MKITFPRLLAAGIFCFTSYLLQAQTNYRPGYIITLKKDTIHGQIDYRMDRTNALSCALMPEGSTEMTTYSPYDILGYRFTDDGKYYVSRTVELSRSEKPQSIFLEYLLQGMKSLYFYENDDKEPFYFIEQNNRLIRIEAPDRIIKDDKGREYSMRVNRYISILHYAFGDCPELSEKIDKTRFTHKGMIDIAKDYHYAMCKSGEDCIQFETKVDKHSVKFAFTPYVGAMQYLFLSSDDAEYATPDLSYLAGLNVAITNKRWMGLCSFMADLSISKLKGSSDYNAVYYSIFDKKAYEEEVHQDFSLTMLAIKMGVRYTFSERNVRPFVGVGIGFSGLVAQKVVVRERGVSYEKEYNNVLSGLLIGYYANVGMQIKVAKRLKHFITVCVQFDNPGVYPINEGIVALSGNIGYTF